MAEPPPDAAAEQPSAPAVPPEGAGPPAGSAMARAALERARSQARTKGIVPGRVAVTGARRVRSNRRRRWAGPGPDDRDPQLLGAAVDEMLTDRGWEQRARSAAVLGRWDQLVGAELASHCRPESLRDGELVLAAESTAWATQVRLLGRDLITRLNSELGAGVVRRVRVHGPTAPSWAKGPRRVAGRGPRDTYG